MPEARDIVFFDSPGALRDWFAAHAEREAVLWVGYHRKHTGKPSLTWPESVDEALCVGWIDGVRKTVDADAYTIRFTRRTPGSHWSRINIARVAVLTREGRMRPAGLAAFEARMPERSGRASYEQRHEVVFDSALARRFRAAKAAWRFFEAQPPGYRRIATFYVMSAKKPETRLKRLDRLIADSADGRRLT
jgi:uncharacterized protein YdeI (YjbR/CyaY-like superfamily)